MFPSSTSNLFQPAGRSSSVVSKTVKMHIEHRPPPLKLTQRKLIDISEKYASSKKNGLPSPFPLRRGVRYPTRETNRVLKKSSPKEPKFFIDTPTTPLIPQLLDFKEKSLIEGRFHNRLWIPNPSAIDAESFYIKAATYLFNLDHEGGKDSKGKQKSSGKDKAVRFLQHLNLDVSADSINKLYRILACDLARPETSLYEISYTERGIEANYLTAFQSYSPDNDIEQLYYIDHTWTTLYVVPDEKDIESFKKSRTVYDSTGLSNINFEDSFLDGWAELVTAFIRAENKLSNAKQDFVKKKYGIKKEDVGLVESTAQTGYNLWQIENEQTLLAHSNDWREGIPAYKHFSEPDLENINDSKGLFIPLPKIHFKYDPNNYPPEESGDTVTKIPDGQFYGVID